MDLFEGHADQAPVLEPHPNPELVEFQLDDVLRHIVHHVHIEELPDDSLSTIQEEGTTNSISGLDGMTGSTSTAVITDSEEDNDEIHSDEFPKRIKNFLGYDEFLEFPPGFGGAVFAVSNDEPPPVVESVADAQAREARNAARAARRAQELQAQQQAQAAAAAAAGAPAVDAPVPAATAAVAAPLPRGQRMPPRYHAMSLIWLVTDQYTKRLVPTSPSPSSNFMECHSLPPYKKPWIICKQPRPKSTSCARTRPGHPVPVALAALVITTAIEQKAEAVTIKIERATRMPRMIKTATAITRDAVAMTAVVAAKTKRSSSIEAETSVTSSTIDIAPITAHLAPRLSPSAYV